MATGNEIGKATPPRAAKSRDYDRLIDIHPLLSRGLAFCWGLLYAALGATGLAVANLSLFAQPAGGGYVLGLRVNGLAAVFYLTVGIPGLACAFSRCAADTYLRWVFRAGLVLFLATIFMSQSTSYNWFAANGHVVGLGLITTIGAIW